MCAAGLAFLSYATDIKLRPHGSEGRGSGNEHAFEDGLRGLAAYGRSGKPGPRENHRYTGGNDHADRTSEALSSTRYALAYEDTDHGHHVY